MNNNDKELASGIYKFYDEPTILPNIEFLSEKSSHNDIKFLKNFELNLNSFIFLE